MKAYSYSRYSSDAQKHGTSIDRQQTLARKWCKDNGIELSDTVFADEAVSGFHGANVSTGALGQFIAQREAGDIEAGSYLILENLDRLTRMEPWDAVALLQRLLGLEITVVTLRPEMKFQPEKRDSMQLLQAILHLDNAHKESARKSDLGKIEWEKRFKRARESKHHIGKRVSNWLDLADDGKYYENENAYAVREIFRLCLEGHGSTVIAQTLNAADTPTFNKGKRWGTTAVIDILKNRAAIGELVLKDGGESVPDYFPAVVDRDTFDAAQRLNTARKTGKITKQSANFNVWQKLVFCGACGSNMHIIKRSTYRYLMCANRRYGQCEGSKNVRLDESEDVFKEMLLHLDALSLVMPDPEKISRELAVAEGRLHAEQSKLAIWVDKLSAHPEVETYHRLVLESEGRIRELKVEVERLIGQLSTGEKLDWSELRAMIDLTDTATRRRANTFFHRLGVQVRIAEGYLLVQHDEARAMFAVAKGKIGFLAVDGEGEIPGAVAADGLALSVKKLIVKPSGGFVARGIVTLPNGRGTRRKKETV
jgi:DNA invertase Pin-like site-specific DNA recombinase